MKFANIIFDGNRKGSINVGDDMQLIAIENLYRYMGIDYDDVVRIPLSELSNYSGEYLVLPISFPLYGYRESTYVTMFSPKIIPVFLGLSIMSNDFSNEEIAYLRRFEPIGCRDMYTVNRLREKNISAYMNGCMTATLPRKCKNVGTDIYFVDLPKSYEKYIPNNITEVAIRSSQVLGECENPEKEAQRVLQKYIDNAKLVVTTRLHCALPCIASGVPVVMMKEEMSFRFSTLEPYIQVYTSDEFSEIDWCPKPIEYEDKKQLILENAKNRIIDSWKRYEKLAVINDFYESNIKKTDYIIEHYDNVRAYICSKFPKDKKISYAIWGITQKADLICAYMEKEYPNAQLAVVHDRNKKIKFHGVESTQDERLLCDPEVFVFVTTASANNPAVNLFEKCHKTNYHISTDGIVAVGEKE